MAEWIRQSLASFDPKSILDAGCGRGWMMTAIREIYPNAVIEGVEPSEQESENARNAGFRVITAKVDKNLDLGKQYDLIYSANVVEHTTDPVDFLRSLGSCIRDDGLIAIICPDSSIPSAEFMFSDQNYSFTPQQLMQLAELSGLKVIKWKTSPETSSVNSKQLVLLSKSDAVISDNEPSDIQPHAPDEIFRERCRYVESYRQCDQYLVDCITCHKTIYNFGTSTWSLLLAAYCPKYWGLVTSCVIDGDGGMFQGKPVRDFSKLSLPDEGIFILGVNPLIQPELSRRLTAKNIPNITWNHLINK